MTKKLLLTTMLLLSGSIAVATQPKVIAHRGYWATPGSAQNSLSSFLKADSIGVYGSEFDVWLTGDDKLVVNHDRIYPGTEIDMEQATQRTIMTIALPNGEQIPSLDTYLKTAAAKPDTRLILELKSLSEMRREDIAAEKVVKAIAKYGLTERTDFICFSLNACLAFRKLLPDARVYYLSGDLSPRKIKELGMAGIDYSMGALRNNPGWIAEAHALGLEVNVWTVNSEEDMRYFIAQGVDYITTDYPERLQALLAE